MLSEGLTPIPLIAGECGGYSAASAWLSDKQALSTLAVKPPQTYLKEKQAAATRH